MSTVTGTSRTRINRAERRSELIDATIDCLARYGYEGTTIGVVAEAVGMSRGIVNFHFETKEQLLLETLRFLSDEYRDHWRATLAQAGPSAPEKLWAMVLADFDRSICTPRKLAAWCAFRGEAKARPTYRSMCNATDQENLDVVAELCAELVPVGIDAHKLARAIVCMLEGLWLHLLIAPKNLSREEARDVAASHLAIVLPDHFTPSGPVPTARASLGRSAPEAQTS
ncbi:TetR/AcrR family transcriptional regulator [Labrys sp. ZIDIC5]|uniref:TetR/AcrR family transcriptional regulator n=1 Tax=Labrys sedimenti TaxID=3106036 RepID=UPI002ACA2B92|nr:TetR family transcriptional regulator C-terminal domain-containing protein [Labrys sp. ZIDIC5]MDZ5453278.1 TetR family transcriptional regulator C-terminal domain-containing protein [Labrys sp. ZIDIC5]